MINQPTEIINKINTLDFAAGEKFGSRYQIVEVIGQGGMGKVFKARDLELNEYVALKMILPNLSSNPDMVARFKRELQLAREINHDHVIRIHDIGEINGIKFISMKYIAGQTLNDILKSAGILSSKKIIHIAKQLCEALSAAHKKGVVHRDLKPQNIMLDNDDSIFVLDFGIARSAASTGITQQGIILGTPDFMSPEQINGENSDFRTDIYALGIILYEMATGKHPFHANTPAESLAKHLHEKPVPPAKLNAQIPKFLQKIILRCIEKKPEDRFQSMDEILKNLDAGEQSKSASFTIQHKWLCGSSKKGKSRKIIKITLLSILALYLGLSILSLITDLIYKSKLDEAGIEYRVFNENYFPITKSFLPREWQTRDCNAWDTYTDVFSTSQDNFAKIKRIGNRVNWFWREYSKKNLDEFSRMRSKWEASLRIDEIVNAIHCTILNPRNNAQHEIPSHYIDAYSKLIFLLSRMDISSNNVQRGVNYIVTLGYLLNDILISSPRINNYNAAINNFRGLCIDLVPVILAEDIKLSSGEIKSIVQMIETVMNSMSPKILCRQNYFSDIAEMSDMVQNKKNNWGLGYFLLYKFFFPKHFFSANKWLFELLQYNKKIKIDFEFITAPQQRLEYTFKLKQQTPVWIFEIPPVYSYLGELYAARTIGKLILILIKERSYGINSPSFLNLKGTDLFINEMTGNPFVINSESDGKTYLYLTEKDKIEMTGISYNSDFKLNSNDLRRILIKHFNSTEDYLTRKYSEEETN